MLILGNLVLVLKWVLPQKKNYKDPFFDIEILVWMDCQISCNGVQKPCSSFLFPVLWEKYCGNVRFMFVIFSVNDCS